MTNESELRENFILRLFDTIKESNNIVINTISKQTDALDSFGAVVKEGVQNEELKDIIKDHNKVSNEKLNKLTSKVNIMIACVSIAFTISAVSYFIVRSSIDNIINKRLEQHNIVMQDDEHVRETNYTDLEFKINQVLKRIEELHKNDKKDEKYGPTK